MKNKTKILLITVPLLTNSTVSQAATLYFQDFTNPGTSSTNGTLVDDTGYNATNGETITGGSAATQATDGDYTITLNRSTAFAAGDGYTWNSSTDAGFSAIDTSYSFETGIIAFTHDSIAYSGTFFIDAAEMNVGSEFLSINSIAINQDSTTQEVTLDFNFNAFGDWQPSGNEDLNVTTNFGAGGDVTSLDIATELGFTASDQSIPVITYSLVLAPAIPEPSSTALLGLGSLALLLRRNKRS